MVHMVGNTIVHKQHASFVEMFLPPTELPCTLLQLTSPPRFVQMLQPIVELSLDICILFLLSGGGRGSSLLEILSEKEPSCV